MYNIELSDYLRELIKLLRKKNKKKVTELVDAINKGPAYLYQLESGKIKEIDFYLLKNLYLAINGLTDLNDNNFIDALLDEVLSMLQPSDIVHEKWIYRLAYEIRTYKITDSLVSLISEMLLELACTPENFSFVINQNNFFDVKQLKKPNCLCFDIADSSKQQFNILSLIRFHLPLDYIKKILSKEITNINYITMYSILFTIFFLESNDFNNAFSLAEKVLFDNGFLNIMQRRNRLTRAVKQKRTDDTLELYDIPSSTPNDYESIYAAAVKDITTGFCYIKDKRPDYTLERLGMVQANMHDDLGLTFAVMSAPLYQIPRDKKKEFFQKFRELLDEYISLEDYE